jgi:hypothetical protein
MSATKIMKGDNDARALLLALGMGHYNATIAIQYMFLAPSATDPAMPSIILMTEHLQAGLRAAGANVAITGQIDEPTARALIMLVGPEWNHVSWFALFQAVVQAKRTRTLARRGQPLGFIDLPDVPGGNLAWAAAGAVAIYFLLRKKH